MQIGLYLELAHELGVLPIACIHSTHPVIHQRPTLHATSLCLGIGMSGRTFSKVGEIHLNLVRALHMARPGQQVIELCLLCDNAKLSDEALPHCAAEACYSSHQRAVFANCAFYYGHTRLFMLKMDNSEEARQYPFGGHASCAQAMMTCWHHRSAAEQARLVNGTIQAKEGSRLTLAEGGAMRLAICSSSHLVRPKSLRRLRRS